MVMIDLFNFVVCSFKKSANVQSQSVASSGNASSEASGTASSATGHHALENGAPLHTRSRGTSPILYSCS